MAEFTHEDLKACAFVAMGTLLSNVKTLDAGGHERGTKRKILAVEAWNIAQEMKQEHDRRYGPEAFEPK